MKVRANHPNPKVNQFIEWLFETDRLPIRHRATAVDLVQSLPFWVLRELTPDGEVQTFLAVTILSSWSVRPGDPAEVSLEDLAQTVERLEMLLHLEELRRLGVHRYSISGDGHLLGDKVHLEMRLNPAIRLSACPSEEDLQQSAALALSTDWADPEARRYFGMSDGGAS